MTANESVLDAKLEEIASTHLGIQTLTTRDSNLLDFHDVAVWSLKAALKEAVELGRTLQRQESV